MGSKIKMWSLVSKFFPSPYWPVFEFLTFLFNYAQVMNRLTSRASVNCQAMMTHTNPSEKEEVTLLWYAPENTFIEPCVQFRYWSPVFTFVNLFSAFNETINWFFFQSNRQISGNFEINNLLVCFVYLDLHKLKQIRHLVGTWMMRSKEFEIRKTFGNFQASFRWNSKFQYTRNVSPR